MQLLRLFAGEKDLWTLAALVGESERPLEKSSRESLMSRRVEELSEMFDLLDLLSPSLSFPELES